MNTWRYGEGLVLLLWVLRVVLYPFKRTAIHRVDEVCQYAMALEEVGKKKKGILYVFSISPSLSLKNHFLLHSSRSEARSVASLHPEGDRSSEGAKAASISYVCTKFCYILLKYMMGV